MVRRQVVVAAVVLRAVCERGGRLLRPRHGPQRDASTEAHTRRKRGRRRETEARHWVSTATGWRGNPSTMVRCRYSAVQTRPKMHGSTAQRPSRPCFRRSPACSPRPLPSPAALAVLAAPPSHPPSSPPARPHPCRPTQSLETHINAPTPVTRHRSTCSHLPTLARTCNPH